jgi:hypothetical protein
MTFNFTLFWQFFSGSGQILLPGQEYRSPGLAKIAPWLLACRECLSAKVSHDTLADVTTSTFCKYPLAVGIHD